MTEKSYFLHETYQLVGLAGDAPEYSALRKQLGAQFGAVERLAEMFWQLARGSETAGLGVVPPIFMSQALTLHSVAHDYRDKVMEAMNMVAMNDV
jgi:hypothetical protein